MKSFHKNTNVLSIMLPYNELIMCEMIDEIEIEHLRMVLARARKEMQESVKEESLIAIA